MGSPFFQNTGVRAGSVVEASVRRAICSASPRSLNGFCARFSAAPSMAPSALMNRRRVSADSTVSSLSRNSGVPAAFAPGTINSETMATVAN